MKLLELFVAVKEKNLSKDQLEAYRDEMASLYADIQVEMADIEKREAVYFIEKKIDNVVSDVSIKRLWRASEDGQRFILLNRYIKGMDKLLSSLKSRLYSQY